LHRHRPDAETLLGVLENYQNLGRKEIYRILIQKNKINNKYSSVLDTKGDE
jgi:hypothetical protein